MNNTSDTQQQLIAEWVRRSEEFARAYLSASQPLAQTSQTDLLQEADALAATYFPLPMHLAARCDVHTREAYATMLAAMALNNGHLSANQSRLFGMLLAALDLPGAQPRLLAQVPHLQRDALGEFLRLSKAENLSESFLLDAMILCRLDGPLTSTQNQLFSEMAEFVQVDTDQLLVLSCWAAKVLGLPFDYSLLPNQMMSIIDVKKDAFSKKIKKHFDLLDCKIIFSLGDYVTRNDRLFDFKLSDKKLTVNYYDVACGGVKKEIDFVSLKKQAEESPVTGVICSISKAINGKYDLNDCKVMILPLPDAGVVWSDCLENCLAINEFQ